MKRNAWILGLLAIVVALMITAPRFLKPRRHGQQASAVTGHTAPDFELKDIHGKMVKLSDFRGKAIVLNFWATWCAPCKTEIPWFEDLQDKYGNQGLTVVGVALDESSDEEIANYAKEMKINYPVLLGKEETSDLYGGVDALPTTFYIDRNGKIITSIPGLIDRKEIEDYIIRALNTKTEAATSQPGAPLPKQEGAQ